MTSGAIAKRARFWNADLINSIVRRQSNAVSAIGPLPEGLASLERWRGATGFRPTTEQFGSLRLMPKRVRGFAASFPAGGLCCCCRGRLKPQMKNNQYQ
jgi:hypothetical protein